MCLKVGLDVRESIKGIMFCRWQFHDKICQYNVKVKLKKWCQDELMLKDNNKISSLAKDMIVLHNILHKQRTMSLWLPPNSETSNSEKKNSMHFSGQCFHHLDMKNIPRFPFKPNEQTNYNQF